MKKKILSLALCGILIALSPYNIARAATSPTTSTATVVSVDKNESIYVPRNSTGAVSVVTANGTSVRIVGDYSSVSDYRAIATAVSPLSGKDSITDALRNYVSANDNSGYLVGPFKIRMYIAGNAIWSGFGTFSQSFGVGNGYEGRTAIVYQIHRDGTVTATTTTVIGGQVHVTVNEMGSFMVVIK